MSVAGELGFSWPPRWCILVGMAFGHKLYHH